METLQNVAIRCNVVILKSKDLLLFSIRLIQLIETFERLANSCIVIPIFILNSCTRNPIVPSFFFLGELQAYHTA